MKTAKFMRKSKCSLKIRSNTDRIRVCVYKSNKYSYVQLIDDATFKTITSLDDRKIKGENKLDKAQKLGIEIGKIAKQKKLNKLTFDRRGYKFHGIIKAIAEGIKKSKNNQ